MNLLCAKRGGQTWTSIEIARSRYDVLDKYGTWTLIVTSLKIDELIDRLSENSAIKQTTRLCEHLVSKNLVKVKFPL